MWTWRVCDHQSHALVLLLEAMDAADQDITHGRCQGWIRDAICLQVTSVVLLGSCSLMEKTRQIVVFLSFTSVFTFFLQFLCNKQCIAIKGF